MPPPRFGIVDQLREPRVHFGATKRIGRLVGACSEERVREPNPVALELDYPRVERRRESHAPRDSPRGLYQLHASIGEGSGREQELATLRGKRQQPSVDELVQRVRDGQRLAGLDGMARALQRSDDLERVERVPAGGLVHLGEKRTGKRDSEVASDDVVQRARIEWAYFDCSGRGPGEANARAPRAE